MFFCFGGQNTLPKKQRNLGETTSLTPTKSETPSTLKWCWSYLEWTISRVSLVPSEIEWDLTHGTLKEVASAIKYSGLGVRSGRPVGDFLDWWCFCSPPVWNICSSTCTWCFTFTPSSEILENSHHQKDVFMGRFETQLPSSRILPWSMYMW